MQYLIGSDVGTSGTKTVLFDETGKFVESGVSGISCSIRSRAVGGTGSEGLGEAVLATVLRGVGKTGIAPDKVKGVGYRGRCTGSFCSTKRAAFSGKALSGAISARRLNATRSRKSSAKNG